MRKYNVAFSPPDISDLEINEVVESLKSGWITTGKRTKLFENKLAEYIGASKSVCLNSATAALELTLRILGIKPGDEVITSAYTYTATAAVVAHVGAKLVLVDTAKESFEMDYQKLAEAITERTKVIIAVDLGGHLCDYKKIYEIIYNKKNLFQANNKTQELFNRIILVSDSAHGLGGKQFHQDRWKASGLIADFTTFSFHAVKNLTTGEGGAVTWKNKYGLDNEWLYHEYMLMSLHGQSKDAFSKSQLGAWEYDVVYPGYKCNMTDIQAAIGLKQLERYPQFLKKRKKVVEAYDEALLPFGIMRLIHSDKQNISSNHLYLLRIPDINEEQRNAMIFALAEEGVGTNVHYKPLPMMTAYKNLGFDISDYPNAYHQYSNEITLPLNTKLTQDEIEYVIFCIKKLLTGM